MKLGAWILFALEIVGSAVLTMGADISTTVVMPIQLKNGYLVIAKGSIGHLKNLAFLVDTGTSRTLIDSRITKKLQLTGEGDKLTIFDHEIEVKLVDLPDLQLGAIHAQSPRVIVTDLSGAAQRFGLLADAIVGMDVLRLGSLTIDYDAKRIWFGDGAPATPALPLEQSSPYLIVKARLDDFPLTLMIDTGCEDVVLFANRLPAGLRKGHSQLSRALTVAEEALLTRIGSGKLTIGSFPAHEITFRVIATGSNDMGYDGILGVRALHASRFQFNFEQMTVSWR
jgi:predicted aspartyl protease